MLECPNILALCGESDARKIFLCTCLFPISTYICNANSGDASFAIRQVRIILITYIGYAFAWPMLFLSLTLVSQFFVVITTAFLTPHVQLDFQRYRSSMAPALQLLPEDLRNHTNYTFILNHKIY